MMRSPDPAVPYDERAATTIAHAGEEPDPRRIPMTNPVLLTVNDGPEVLNAIERDLALSVAE